MCGNSHRQRSYFGSSISMRRSASLSARSTPATSALGAFLATGPKEFCTSSGRRKHPGESKDWPATHLMEDTAGPTRTPTSRSGLPGTSHPRRSPDARPSASSSATSSSLRRPASSGRPSTPCPAVHQTIRAGYRSRWARNPLPQAGDGHVCPFPSPGHRREIALRIGRELPAPRAASDSAAPRSVVGGHTQ